MRVTWVFSWRVLLMLLYWTQITWFFPARSSSCTRRLLKRITQLFTRCCVLLEALITIGKDCFPILIGIHSCWSKILTLMRWRCLIEGDSSKSAGMIPNCINSAGLGGKITSYGCELH